MSFPAPRHLVASVLSVAAVFALASGLGGDWYILIFPLSLLAISAVLIHAPALAPQLLARAAWWSNLALGTVLTVSSSSRERTSGALLALTTGLALLVAGRKQLGEASAKAGYVPAALRSALMLLMVFALADAQTFLLFGTAGLIDHATRLGRTGVMLGIGVAYLVGFVGLYRLQVWGAILNIVLSFVVFGVVGAGTIEVFELSIFLAILAVLHILVALPVTLAALRRRPLPGLSLRSRGIVANGAVVLVMAFAGLMSLIR